MKSMELTHSDNTPTGLILTVGFFLVSVFTRCIELTLPEVDIYLLFCVHLVQLVAGLCAIFVGYFTIKSAIENHKKNKDDKGN